MSAEWLTAVGSIGTFVVIAASAVAALIQLRHMRGSNQIVALTECRETLESPEFQEAQQFVAYDLPGRFKDPREILRVAGVARVRTQFEGEYRAISTVANFFENLGVFVKNGIIDHRLACDTWAYVILRNWNALEPVVTFVREDVGMPAIWENFEYLAVLSQRYYEDNPTGSYPSGFGRMPKSRSFIDAVKNARTSSK